MLSRRKTWKLWCTFWAIDMLQLVCLGMFCHFWELSDFVFNDVMWGKIAILQLLLCCWFHQYLWPILLSLLLNAALPRFVHVTCTPMASRPSDWSFSADSWITCWRLPIIASLAPWRPAHKTRLHIISLAGVVTYQRFNDCPQPRPSQNHQSHLVVWQSQTRFQNHLPWWMPPTYASNVLHGIVSSMALRK